MALVSMSFPIASARCSRLRPRLLGSSPQQLTTFRRSLMPAPAPLAPLRSRAHLRLRLPHSPSPSPWPSPSPLLSRAPSHRWPPPLRASASGGHVRGGVAAGAAAASSALDALLSAAELLCLAPPAICSVVCAARLVFPPPPTTGASASVLVGGRLFVVQYVLMVGAVAIGSLIRRRQWGRLCRVGGGGAAARGVDFAGRIGEVEVSVRGVVAAVAVLSRTVEKLGIRFRVLRRTLRDPINETATLAQKNSEATRVLAAQEDLLEKELGEIQKVLYAMQEQQQKQLELILAIGEASRILDDKEELLGATPEKENKQADVKAETVAGGNNRP